MLPIINPTELLKLERSGNLILVDASGGPNTKANYDTKHLEGALFVDLNSQLADIKEDVSVGGRHPLATITQFAQTLTDLGITAQSHVVVYDDKNGANAAARFWWMLKAIGHEKVQVLDGGFQAAEKAGFPVSSKVETANKVIPYKVENWNLPVADLAEVERVSQDGDYIVIDVRDRERYNGEKEPIDLVAGHIPGAVNVPLTENLDTNGFFKTPEELKKKYQSLFNERPAENVIVHCGSGVTACHTLLAAAYAGFEIPKLYVGSWSEWSRNGKTIATKLS